MDTRTAHSEAATRLKRRLRDQLRWLRMRLVGHALVMLLGGVGAVLGVAAVAQPGWSALGPAGAWALWVVLLVAVVWVGFFEILRPLRRIANLKGFSRELERHGTFGNLLEAATQFSSPRREDPLRRGASAELVAEILRRASDAAEAARLAPRVPLLGVATNVAVALGALALWLTLALSGTPRVAETFRALGDPSRLAVVPPTEGLYALTGDLRVPVGGEVELIARDFVGGDQPVVLEVNTSGDFWQERPVESRVPALTPAPYLEATITLDHIEDPFRYRFRKGTLRTPVHEVAIRERPVLTSLQLRLEPPAYSGRSVVELSDPSGTVAVLEGTEVVLRGSASSALSSAERRVEDGPTVPLEVAASGFSDRFTVTEDLRFRIGLVDAEGLANEAMTLYQFAAESDDAPTVQITAPAEDRNLDRGLTVGIAGIAADDVGLERLDLVYRTEVETEWERRPLWLARAAAREGADVLELEIDRGEQDVAVSFTWDVGDLSLLPGDALLYALEATDNNALAGGQVTRSRVYRLRLPTIAEIFDIDREERAEDSGDLRDLLAEGEELRDDLERLERELKKNPEPDWAKQQEIRETLERQAELRERLKDTAEEMQQQLDQFEKDNAGSMELLQKMETIQELLQELKDDEALQAYLEAMQEAMDQLQPHEVQRQMQDALTEQDEFNRRLDRTIELLKQLERERTMSDLVEEVSEYLKRQEQLAELTDPAPEETEDPSGSEAQEPGEESSEEQDAPPSETGESSEEDASESPQSQEGESAESEQSESGESEPSESEDGEREMTDEELARAQEQLAEEARKLEERLREALEQLQKEQQSGEAQDPAAGEMEKALEQALENMQQEGKPSESMQDAQEKITQGQRQEAGEAQTESMGRLLHLYEVLAEGMQGMQQATGQYAFEKLQQTAFDLLNLSFSEEKLVDALRDGIRGQQMRPITREQGRIQRGAGRISEDLHDLASKNFMISERLLAEMRELVELLEDAVDEMQLARSRRSRDTAIDTMAKMNRIVINLLTAARNSQSGSGGGAQPSPSQQMQQMTQDQQRLNGMTRELRQRMQQGLSEQERRQLAEMQGRQQAIREQLEQLREQFDDERRILGDLDDLAEQMERVEDDLGAGELDEDTQRQQEKILSRLLDAQRSVRERDFAKRRESRGTEELFREQLGSDLSEELAEQERALRRWLAPEKAPHVYQEDVRRYFRKIQGELDQLRGEGR